MIGLVSDRCLWLIETLVICHILLTTIGLTPGGNIECTFTNKQYTKQHNEREYPEQNKHNNNNT